MSYMQSWAEREIEIACKLERADKNPNGTEWDYGCTCYESALKAYKSLIGDGHSGYSIGITQNILNKLIEGKPLTPMEDIEDVWNDISNNNEDDYVSYQCKRMSSLFKYVYNDGHVEYKDINSSYCIDINNNQNTYHSSLVRKIIEEMFPITMPYIPSAPIKVFCKEFLVNPKNGDYDTVGVIYCIQPGQGNDNGVVIEINRFFKEENNEWIEIDQAEYSMRESHAVDLPRR